MARALSRRFVRIALATVAVGGATLAGGPFAGAEEGNAPPAGRLTLATRHVVVFKDGYALFSKTATGKADANGLVHTERVPDGAVLGCVWALSDGATPRALAMRSEWIARTQTASREGACASLVEVLRANVGRAVTLGLVPDPEPGALSATILEVLDPPGDYVVVETKDGRAVLPVASIRTVRGPGLVTKTVRTTTTQVREKRLTFDFGPEAAGRDVALRLFYFTEGVRWIPTYRLVGDFAKDADLSLQGEVLDEAEDVEDAEWSLVVGVPNFRFKDTPSPLALEATLRVALDRAAPALRRQLASQSLMSNAGVREGRDDDDHGGPAPLATAPGLASTGEQDLFVYSVGRMSLRRGARAALPLWNARVPIRHVYTWAGVGGSGWARDQESRAPGGSAGASSPLRVATNATWHQLEIQNRSTVPWTTGPALLLRDAIPLGQDLLTYTPVGATALVPVTVAVDVRTDYEEVETERTPEAYVWGKYAWARVRRTGTLRVVNRRSEATTWRATLDVVGAAHDADKGEVSRQASDDVNARSRVTFEVTLAPGESATRTVAIEFYVR